MPHLVRRLAVLALLTLLALPAPGAAEPIVEPPQGETLVEGHTVFVVIDSYRQPPPAPASALPAARTSDDAEALAARHERFPGVLWYNDQYLVPPTVRSTEALGANSTMRTSFAAALSVLVRKEEAWGVREPCGGAILAVNQGDPDPRGVLLSVDGRDPVSRYEGRSAWVGVDTGSQEVYSDSLATASANAVTGDTGLLPYDYEESYRLTDPNGRAWVVDKYVATVRASLRDGVHVDRSFPVWVANLHGGETFVPDRSTLRVGGHDTHSCGGALRLADALTGPAQGMTCGAEPLPHLLAPMRDDPCMGYAEPSRSGFCYAGPLASLDSGCSPSPPRRHSALLYFRWDDLSTPGAPRDHCGFSFELGGCHPALIPDTNGCHSGTDWPCPGEAPWEIVEGADDLEGASHAFHPAVPPHREAGACPLASPNPTNHGGSATAVERCDYEHATARVDVYYSGGGRPAPPAVRWFAVDDAEGSGAPFHDFAAAYPQAI